MRQEEEALGDEELMASSHVELWYVSLRRSSILKEIVLGSASVHDAKNSSESITIKYSRLKR